MNQHLIDLHAQRKKLSHYDHLNRFGGRYITVCTGLYRVAAGSLIE